MPSLPGGYMLKEIEKFSKKSRFWRRILEEAKKPRRRKRVVNIYKLNKYTKANDVVFVPGKVLGVGKIDHPIIISAFSFSKSAYKKITDAGGKVLMINEFMKAYPSGRYVKIIG